MDNNLNRTTAAQKRARIDTLTDQDHVIMTESREWWTANALRTTAMTDEEWAEAEAAILDVYQVEGLAKPAIFHHNDPITAAMATPIVDAWQQALSDAEPYTEAQAASAVARVLQAFEERATEIRDLVCYVMGKPHPEDTTDDQATSDLVDTIKEWVANWSDYYMGGYEYSYRCSFYDAMRHMGLDIDWSEWLPYERYCANAGPAFMCDGFVIVTDRQTALHMDEENRLHHEWGPARAWASGRALYYWHGVSIPSEWITDRDNMDPTIALTWPNAEQRRCAAEIMGWHRVIAQLNPITVDADPDPEIGTLLQVDLPDSPGERFLQVRCGTGRTFALPVPPDMRTARQANAWTYSLEPDEYGPEVRT